MASKFNPDDLKNPVYEYSQVVTDYDLKVIYHGLAKQYQDAKWWDIRGKFQLAIAGNVIYELLSWLHDGKPALRK